MFRTKPKLSPPEKELFRAVHKEITEIPHEKSNGPRHSVWVRDYGLQLKAFNSFKSVQLIWIYFLAGRSLITSNFIIL